MRKHDLLRALHQVLQPRTYFEIGVRKGTSMSLSRTTSIGVDPFYLVTNELHCDLHLVRSTSDEFFARDHPFAHFPRPVIDLAFIDGMHLAEYALRDFINTERYCHPGSVVVIDDVLPRNDVEAGRGREGSAKNGAWAGDVYKMVDVLRDHRPDLVVLEVDTSPTGTVVILLPDPDDARLASAYEEIVPELVTPDPQTVPEPFLSRSRAIDPRTLVASPVWDDVRRLRTRKPKVAREALASVYDRAGLTTRGAR